MAKLVYQITSVKFGTPTNLATMPETLTAWSPTVEGSCTVVESDPQTKEIKSEESVAPEYEIKIEEGSLEIKWKSFDMTPANLAIVKGGTSTATKYTAPGTLTLINLALQINAKDADGNNVKFNVFKASIKAKIDGVLTRTDVLQVSVSAKALAPASGLAPWEIDFS